MNRIHTLLLLSLILIARTAFAKPPDDPAARKIYDHNYEWLSHFPPAFIANNIRGENDKQYPERRQAALDYLRQRRELAVVSELMDELKRGSFLSGDICDTLGEWQATKALPLLKEVGADPKRPADVRERAATAAKLIAKKPIEKAPSHPIY
jgi:hypothetical protein